MLGTTSVVSSKFLRQSIYSRTVMDIFRVIANPIFSIHNPLVITLLTRLRVGLSHLHEHKYRQNFLDTRSPFCTCDGKSIESVEHYLLRCPNHARYRTVLFENLNSKRKPKLLRDTPLWQKVL